MKRLLTLAFILFFGTAAARTAVAATFDVKAYGARGDGSALETAAFQQAIDACAAAGGGQVTVPPGTYLLATIELRTGVILHVNVGARLIASGDPAHYRLPHLIYAKNAARIGLMGGGEIDGQSDLFFDADMKPKEFRLSPLIELVGCREVRVEGLTLRKSPAWMLRPKNCEGVIIRGIALLNDLRAVNSDGIDIDSSRNVVISDCRIVAGDDCIVLKTTDRGGPPESTENVVVTNCVLESSASALKLGTESLGDFRHIVFSNCVIRDSRTGIALMAKDGGTMEAVHFDNITITTKPKWGRGHEWPIHIDSEKRRDDSKPSLIRDIRLTNITIHTRGRVLIQGQEAAPAENIVLRDLSLRVTGAEDIRGARKITGGTRHTDNVLDLGDKPAAFILGQVRHVRFEGVTIIWSEQALKPRRDAVYASAVVDADFSGVHEIGSGGGVPLVVEDSR